MLALALALGGAVWPAVAEETSWRDTLRERVTPSLRADLQWVTDTDLGRVQKLELALRPEIEVALPADLTLRSVGRMRVDGFDELERDEPRDREIAPASRRGFAGDHVEFELREALVEGEVGRVWFVLGKQTIVWGQADQLKVLDVLNPQSFREFVLPDFEESRIPLWSAQAEIELGLTSLQLVWIPDRTYHDLPGPRPIDTGGLYEFRAPEIIPRPPPGLPLEVREPRRPDGFFPGSDAGARLRGVVGGWDWSLHYLYHYADEPSFFSRVVATPDGPLAVVTPRYRRNHLVGASFSNAFGSLVLRGELVFNSDRHWVASDDDLVKQNEEVLAVIGLDWLGWESTTASLQIFQSWLPGASHEIERGRLQTHATLFLERRFLQDTLHAELRWLVSADRGDGLVRPELRYDVTDRWTTWAGLDVFYGNRRGLFGQFDGLDRFVMGVELAL